MSCPCLLGSCGRQGGLALVIVLWVVAALSVLVLGLSQTSRLQTQLTQHHRAATEARALLEAGLVVGMARVAWFGSINQRDSHAFDLGGAQVQVDIHPATGFIDLNEAPADLLARLFRYGAGLETEPAEALAAAVVDWRDSDPMNRDSRAEGYRGPFRVPEEVGQVPGASRDLHDSIKRYVTLYSGAPQVNPFAAPRGVVGILSGGDEALVDAMMADSGDGFRPRTKLGESLDGLPFLTLAGSSAFRIDVSLQTRARNWRLSRWVRQDGLDANALGVVVLRTEALTARSAGEAY